MSSIIIISSMLKYIEINNSLLHKFREGQETVLRNIHNQCAVVPPSDLLEKKAVPLKEYSNKFLRENQFNVRQKQNEKVSKNSRLNNLITKHKFFQKKFTSSHSKNIYVCKTEPNENQYKCFMTSNNFYKEPAHLRTHTENINPKPNTPFFELDPDDFRKNDSQTELKVKPESEMKPKADAEPKGRMEGRLKSKIDISLGSKVEEKISASRALQMYAKIISKDRSELIEKIKFTNQKKHPKDNRLESRKNLEICQINLLEKQKKMSLAERAAKREKTGNQSLLKFRKKTQSVDQRALLAREEENFELKGWDN